MFAAAFENVVETVPFRLDEFLKLLDRDRPVVFVEQLARVTLKELQPIVERTDLVGAVERKRPAKRTLAYVFLVVTAAAIAQVVAIVIISAHLRPP